MRRRARHIAECAGEPSLKKEIELIKAASQSVVRSRAEIDSDSIFRHFAVFRDQQDDVREIANVAGR